MFKPHSLFRSSSILATLLFLGVILAACGDSTSTPSPTTSTTAPTTTIAATTAAVTTAAPTTVVAATTVAATTDSTTTTAASGSSTLVASTGATPPTWFNKEVPTYQNAKSVTLEASLLSSVGLSASNIYIVVALTPDSVAKIVDFYSTPLTKGGWTSQVVPLTADGSTGQQINFNRTQNGSVEKLILVASDGPTIKAIPTIAPLATKIPDGQNLILLLAKPDISTEAFKPPTTGLPDGVAAKNLTFDFGDGWVADGQITYPSSGTGPFPVVILVHGSGLNDMDETIGEAESGIKGGAKIFQPIAYYLATRGFAVVRYNKRGVIGLGPQVSTDTKFTAPAKPDTQYTQDADFVLKQTLKNPLVDPTRVIMLGHSEGTLDVSHVAVGPDGGSVAGVVLIGVTGYDAKTIMQYQLVDRTVQTFQQEIDVNKDGKVTVDELLKWGATQSATIKAANVDALLDKDASSPNGYKLKSVLDKNGDGQLDIVGELQPILQTESGMANFPNLPGIPASEQAFLADWQQNGNVTKVLPAFKKPVLMLNGEADIQTVVQGARDADAALAAAGNPDHTLITYPGLGHSLYPAKGIDQPLGPPQPAALKDLGDWLAKRFGTAQK